MEATSTAVDFYAIGQLRVCVFIPVTVSLEYVFAASSGPWEMLANFSGDVLSSVPTAENSKRSFFAHHGFSLEACLLVFTKVMD